MTENSRNKKKETNKSCANFIKNKFVLIIIAILSFIVSATGSVGKSVHAITVIVIEAIYKFFAETKQMVTLTCLELFKGLLSAIIGFRNAVARVLHFNKEKDGLVAAGLFAAACISFSFYFFSSYSLGMSVLCSDQPIGTVENEQQFEKLLVEFEQKVAEQVGETYRSPLKFDYRFAFVKNSDTANVEKIEEEILKLSPDIDRLYALSVDGQILASNKDKTEIEKVLSGILNQSATGDDTEKVEFTRDVQIDYQICKENSIKNAGEIQVMLTAPTTSENEITHSVQKGETISIIAKKYGVSTDQLIMDNGEVDVQNLSKGKEITVSNVKSLLPVKIVKQVQYTQQIAYDTEKINDANLYVNRKKTVQKGVNGEEKITAEVTLIDGEEIDRTILNTEVLSAPVTEQIAIGTKPLPASAPTGIFRLPATGIYSSYFGYRGREFHTGLDIAGRYGTPIYAADGGKVVFAGWRGGYGKCVVIEHDDGYETLYGHCSSLLVSVGDKVPKGFNIALMGSTGRSTGTHVHFEIIKDGVQKNPLNYVG